MPPAGAPCTWAATRPRGQGRAATVAPSAAANASAAYSSAAPSAPRVCILGGGFGGLYTAIKLESLMWPRGSKPQVTLIDQGKRFVFKPLLYELLNSTASADEVAPTFAQLLAPYPIQFVQAKVAGVELEERLQDGGSASGGRVLLSNGDSVEYDWLVVSLGAEADPRGVPGVQELARKFTAYEDAVAVSEKLAELEVGPYAPVVVVVGAGYAGVELAAVVAERLKGRGVVKVVTPGASILESSPPGQQEAARKVLEGQGVEVVTGALVSKLTATDGSSPAEQAAGLSSSRCTVHLDPSAAASSSGSGGVGPSGRQVEADLVLWTAGSSPVTKWVQAMPFPTNPRGFLETDSTLRVRSHARVFAIGDVSMVPDADASSSSGASTYYPPTAQVAFQAADYAAWNLWAAMNGRTLLPFRYQHLGNMMSLGAANAAVALPIELPASLASGVESSPLGPLLQLAGVRLGQGVTLEGPLAQLLRRGAYLYRQPTNEQRLSVAASWVAQAAEIGSKLGAELLSGAGAAAGGKGAGR